MRYGFKKYEPKELLTGHLRMGTPEGARSPDGGEISVTSAYFTRDGSPFIGVMGEYHFARGHRRDWYRELCKMRAGGVNIVSTYLFWIYHEEIEGEFDFSGDLDVRAFVLDARRAGLDVVLRLGPWAHGECRNGGFPDWLLKKPFRLRRNDPGYMEKVRLWYGKIFDEVRGLLYKDGGNIIGIQLENELTGDADHLLALKKTALDVGFDLPLYTVTGWNSVFGAKIPVDDVVPVFGAYAVTPWSGGTAPLPPSPNYVFNGMRNDTAIGSDAIAESSAAPDGWRLPYERYPFATCELGGGIEVTHHRRPIIDPLDIYALSLVKLGSGNNLIGYYMYHGGTNKLGRLSTLNESRATGYPNDYAILSYDFQAPISEYGETRAHYRSLNMLHLFAADFGGLLAPMGYVPSEQSPRADDKSSLRYAMRTDGRAGFVFINHYQRALPLDDVRAAVIDTGEAGVVFPPIDVSGEVSFFMPFNMDISGGVLEYATAQPLCRVGNAYFFSAVPGVPPEYKFRGEAPVSAAPGTASTFTFKDAVIITLTRGEALCARKLGGRLLIGCGCDIFECGGDIDCVQPGTFSYLEWTGSGFVRRTREREFTPGHAAFIETDENFTPSRPEELSLGGERRLRLFRVTVDGDGGFFEVPFECDVSQFYRDGELVADNYWYGVPWRLPCSLVFGHECFLVLSEKKDDFYMEP